MRRAERGAAARLLELLCREPGARLTVAGDVFELSGGTMVPIKASAANVRQLASSGLLTEVEPGRLAASDAAKAWLKRRANRAMPFRAQHGTLEASRLEGTDVLVNIDESPVGALLRRPGCRRGAVAEATRRGRRGTAAARL